jgi:hypothetical protein
MERETERRRDVIQDERGEMQGAAEKKRRRKKGSDVGRCVQFFEVYENFLCFGAHRVFEKGLRFFVVFWEAQLKRSSKEIGFCFEKSFCAACPLSLKLKKKLQDVFPHSTSDPPFRWNNERSGNRGQEATSRRA